MFDNIAGITDAVTTPKAEVNQIDNLMEVAKNRIGERDALQQWINKNIGKMPVMPNSADKFITVVREFDKVQQPVNDTLWLIALLSIQQQGFTSTHLLAAVTATSWNESTKGSTVKENWRESSVWILNTLVKLGMVETKIQEMDTDQGKRKQTLFYIDSNWSKKHLNPIIEEMRERTAIVCKPLEACPPDWKEGETEQRRTKLKLVSRKSDTLVECRISKEVLEPLNMLQHVGFEIAEGHEIDIMNCLDAENDDVKRGAFTELQSLTGKRFYFPVSLCYRGRIYYRGGVVHPQAQKEVRQFLNFSEGETVNRLDAIADLTRALADRENPVQRAERDRLEALTDTHVTCKVICNYDGVSNGLQHQSVLLRSTKLAKLTQLIESDLEEVYVHVVNCVVAEGIQVTRKFLKTIIMILSYGATKGTAMKALVKELTPKDAVKVYEIINRELPELKKYTQFISSRCNLFANDSCQIATQDGFELKFRKIDRTPSTLYAGTFSAITDVKYWEDAEATARATAPNLIHATDSAHLRLIIKHWKGSISTIHDSVGVVAGRGKELQQLILDSFVELHTFDILKSWAQANSVPALNNLGELELEDLNNLEMFC